MPPDELLLRLLVSFGGGFLVVAAVTTLADRAGKGRAGFVGGMPWTGPVSLLAIGFTQSSAAAEKALTLFPLGAAATMAFLLFYALPSKAGFMKRMVFALALWGVVASAAASFAPHEFWTSVVVCLTVSLAVLAIRSRIHTADLDRGAFTPGIWRAVMRGLLGGSVVSVVVAIGLVGGPLVGGVFAAAPAVWSSSLYITSRSQGVEFSRSLTWVFMRTGILTVVPYAVSASYFFAATGVWLGTVLSYAAISPLAYLAWRLSGR